MMIGDDYWWRDLFFCKEFGVGSNAILALIAVYIRSGYGVGGFGES